MRITNQDQEIIEVLGHRVRLEDIANLHLRDAIKRKDSTFIFRYKDGGEHSDHHETFSPHRDHQENYSDHNDHSDKYDDVRR